ncbi:MAG: ribonuclease P protein component [Thermodesulfobacteriaceae bacterium]|nr:ribonuclease P protein component [Thermodesulfobacteriaceae bacterium]
MKKEGLSRKERLTKNKDFEKVFKEGKKLWINNLFLIIYKPNPLNYSRIGIVVSKKLRKATQRNKVKRWIREFYRKNKDLFPTSCDMIIIPHPLVVNYKNYKEFYLHLKKFFPLFKKETFFHAEGLDN